MIIYKLSTAAAADIDNIIEYGIENYGLKRASAYAYGLSEAIETLCDHPKLGRRVNNLATDVRRIDYQSHMVFYQLNLECIHIVRVLHNRMDVDDQDKNWFEKPGDSISERVAAYG